MAGRKILFAGGALLLLAGVAGALYMTNPAPVARRIEAADMQDSSRPYVIKVHAQWCPVCMMTRGVWAKVQSAYAGRVNLVVFDVTDERRTKASRAEAARLGLASFFDENSGSTGTVYLLDGRRREITSLQGDREFADYSTAIDAALRPRIGGRFY